MNDATSATTSSTSGGTGSAAAAGGTASSAEDERRSPATPESWRADIVKGTGSGYTPVRREFVQKHSGKSRAATLARLTKARMRRALILYLLLLTVWDPEERRSPWLAAVWLRALDAGPGAQLTWSPSTLSATWSQLVRLKLVKRRRVLRRSRFTPRREDLRKGDYTRPDGKITADEYFILPGAFWTDRWFDRLSLPALAVLLILLRETNKDGEVHLTYERTADWYGISESTAKDGYKELAKEGLLQYRDEVRRSNYTANGLTTERWYSLTGAFSTAARQTAQAEAKKAGDARRRAAKRTTARGTGPSDTDRSRSSTAQPAKAATGKAATGKAATGKATTRTAGKVRTRKKSSKSGSAALRERA